MPNSKNQSVVGTHNMVNHDMTYHDICNDTCYDNTFSSSNHDMSERDINVLTKFFYNLFSSKDTISPMSQLRAEHIF